ncbi:hypothetical protein [Helicovermis profundi]|uniref:Uncharacterized protein n=1 Tax=Helicovermis profundi TaxID=3065157 RepID=A0AAU9EZ88_9FIRM|nr:hypothetical protein HLPR_27710 [Clostridia bacterium S502]
MAKKSFLEKLGLIEQVEEKNESENADVHFVDSTNELNDENLLVTEPEIKDESIAEKELMRKLNELSETEKINDTTSEDIEIGDKLNEIIGSYEKNKLVSIEEIYRNSRLSSDMKKTIFMADVFLKALPENLPVDIKRESVLNILNVSNINFDEILTDAYQRIDALNTVLETTVQSTEDVIAKNESSIRELESRIIELKNLMEVRKKFEEDQNTMIEYEIQKIINIVEFVKPKK